jgi:hypothetical protein
MNPIMNPIMNLTLIEEESLIEEPPYHILIATRGVVPGIIQTVHNPCLGILCIIITSELLLPPIEWGRCGPLIDRASGRGG